MEFDQSSADNHGMKYITEARGKSENDRIQKHFNVLIMHIEQ